MDQSASVKHPDRDGLLAEYKRIGMPELLKGRRGIVVGAGGGIGCAVAVRLAASGADLMLLDRDFGGTAAWGGPASAERVEREVRAAGRTVLTAEGDAADRAFVGTAVERFLDELGSADFVVNCAGGAITPAAQSYASSTSDADLAALFHANYHTVVTVSQVLATPMQRQGSGSIVNITSGLSPLVPRDGSLAHYLAAKAAVSSFTTSLANELGPHGVRANAISPGFILSPRAAQQAQDNGTDQTEQLSRIALRRFGEPDDIAKVAAFLVSDLAGYMTGQVLSVAGG